MPDQSTPSWIRNIRPSIPGHHLDECHVTTILADNSCPRQSFDKLSYMRISRSRGRTTTHVQADGCQAPCPVNRGHMYKGRRARHRTIFQVHRASLARAFNSCPCGDFLSEVQWLGLGLLSPIATKPRGARLVRSLITVPMLNRFLYQ